MNETATLGTVSSGTMREEDLIPAFLDQLERLDKERHDALEEDYCALLNADEPDWESEEASWLLEALFDALQGCAPPYTYFGAHEGDGADYGFWICWDDIEDDVRDGVIAQVQAGEERSQPGDEDVSYFLEVHDHGNATLFDRDGNEIWSCV